MQRFFWYLGTFLGSVLLSLTVLALEPEWVEPSRQASYSFSITPQQSGTWAAYDDRIFVTVSGKTQELTSYDLWEGKLFVDVQDFNFDGAADLNVFQSVGYMGVNLFSQIFLFDATTATFKPSIEGSNLKTDSQQKKVYGYMKSGPYLVQSEYERSAGQLYLARESTGITASICEFKHYNSQARLLTEGVFDCSAGDFEGDIHIKPEARVAVDKAALYNRPESGQKTKMYLIRGDKVRLLKTEPTRLWYLVEFQGAKTITQWLQARDLDLPD